MENTVIETRMKEIENQYKAINEEIQSIIDEVSSKYKTIIDEAQPKIDSLNARREQLRGAYTELMYILHPEMMTNTPEKNVEPEPTEVNNKVTEEDAVTSDNSVTVKTENMQSEPKEKQEVLTPEEIDKINNTVQSVQEQQEVKEEQTDIPDYLKSEYNK